VLYRKREQARCAHEHGVRRFRVTGHHPKEDGPNAPPVALVNEFLARQFFPKGDVLGKQFLIDTGNANEKPWREIVGGSAGHLQVPALSVAKQ